METLPTFEALIATIPALDQTLAQATHYHAHRQRVPGGPAETLAEHMARVMSYFQRLARAHGLDAVVDRLARELVPTKLPAAQQYRLAASIKELLVRAVWFHDFGKVNERFQTEKMLNQRPAGWPAVTHGYGSHHSVLSAYFFAVQGLLKLQTWPEKQAANVLMDTLLALSYPIERHHSPTLSDGLLQHTSFQKPTHALDSYLPILGIETPTLAIQQLLGLGHHQIAQRLATMDMRAHQPFPLYALTRLAFSLLTASDYYATAHYYNGWDDAAPYNDFGLLTGELRAIVIQNARTKQPYNQSVTEGLDWWLSQDPAQWQQASRGNLNLLRSRMAAEVVQQVRQHAHERLFYLHAPTGGGKTNLSILAMAELLATNPELNKVFYVFPFTTLITQTWQALRDTLGLTPDEVIQLHSRADYARRTAAADAEEDAVYDQSRRDELDNLFVNFPVCLLTHIRFADILKTSRKDSNYLLHRLANSVIILDELQSYDPQHWDKLAWLLTEYARLFNIRFILMSATLPRLDKLLSDETRQHTRFIDLLPQAREKFFLNANFRGRVRFDFSLSEKLPPIPELKDAEGRELFLRALATEIHARSEEWAGRSAGQVRTVVEFIFKKTASEFFQIARQALPDYTLVVLSGTILEPRRRDVIQFLKAQPADCPKVLLITTQVVEAGVDIDMDLGFKDRSLLDSEEQLAGRVNRNAGKHGSVLYLFDLDSASVIYDKDKRYKAQEKKLAPTDAEEILNDKNFDRLYDLVMQELEAWNLKPAAQNLHAYQKHFRQLDFPAADRDLQLIDQETQSVFAPVSIALYGQEYRDGDWHDRSRPATPALRERYAMLTSSQQDFLAANGVSLASDRLAGTDVFALFQRLVQRKAGKAADQKQVGMESRQGLKRLQGILALFTFSLFAQSKDMKHLEHSHRARFEYGFWVLESDDLTDLYDYPSGIRTELLVAEAGTLIF